MLVGTASTTYLLLLIIVLCIKALFLLIVIECHINKINDDFEMMSSITTYSYYNKIITVLLLKIVVTILGLVSPSW